MAAEVVMPKFGLTMVEGTIQRWFKNEGDAITEGEALFEVETEKVLYEVESTANGTVAKLLYGLEAVVPVGLPVAVIAEAGEDVAEVAARYSDGAPDSLVFPSARGWQITPDALSKLCHDLELGMTPHGLRSSFRDWCAESAVSRELAEACLAHVVKNTVEAAYRRSDLLEQRREVMNAWARYVT